ncbi:MAG TPA: DNA cytosine methyltransferase [Thermoanaerobaculia bacterium]|nr:DNA cytosine methyltransferase [Thermoanaerobaculia bacterium]
MIRVLELYCGIGGVAAALGMHRPGGAEHDGADSGAAEIVAAVDLDRTALAVYAANFPGPTVPRNLDRAAAGDLAVHRADLWTMSPPCQPYTRRGLRRDLEDPRAASFVALVAALDAVRPPYLFLENVPGFAGSRAHALLRETLDRAGYEVGERLLCPSELGSPNRRRRFYLVASREGRLTWPAEGGPREDRPPRLEPAEVGCPGGGQGDDRRGTGPTLPRRPLADFVASHADPELTVAAATVAAYRHALDVVDAADPAAVTACFTAAYGRSPVRSGSYLRIGSDGGPGDSTGEALPALRRFSPREVLALLGFPASYRLPPELSRATGWRLAGNSLSLPPVRALLTSLPPLAHLGGAAAEATGPPRPARAAAATSPAPLRRRGATLRRLTAPVAEPG